MIFDYENRISFTSSQSHEADCPLVSGPYRTGSDGIGPNDGRAGSASDSGGANGTDNVCAGPNDGCGAGRVQDRGDASGDMESITMCLLQICFEQRHATRCVGHYRGM